MSWQMSGVVGAMDTAERTALLRGGRMRDFTHTSFCTVQRISLKVSMVRSQACFYAVASLIKAPRASISKMLVSFILGVLFTESSKI